MVTKSLRAILCMLLVSSVVYAGVVVDRWRRDSIQLASDGSIVSELRNKNSDLGDKVLSMTSDVATLKASISNQNHAVELAQAETNSAKAQQELAKTFTEKLQIQKDKRIEQLEADLADTSKTLTDLLDTSWRQPR